MVGEGTGTPGNAGAGAGAGSSTPAAAGTGSGTPTGTTTGTPTPAAAPAATSTPAKPESAVASFERAAAALESVSSPDKTGETTPPAGAATGVVKPATPDATKTFHVPQTKEEYDRILGNARTNAVKDAGVEWATKVNQQDVVGALTTFEEIRSDPVGWARGILKEAGEPTGEVEEKLVDPSPAYTSPDGKAQFYSHDQVAVLLANMEKRLTKTFQPALTAAQTQQQREAQAEEMREVQAQATTTATEVMGILKQDPRFETHKDALRDKLSKVDPNVRKKIGAIATLFMCWNAVVAEKVIPNMASDAEKRLKTENDKQAAASVGNIVPGGGQQVRKPVRDGDVSGLASRIGEIATQIGYQG